MRMKNRILRAVCFARKYGGYGMEGLCDRVPSMKVLVLICFAAFSAFAQKITIEFDQAADFTGYK